MLLSFIIVTIIWGCIWGCATQAVINNKNYDENWFWWGFFFGLIAFIVACTKTDNTHTYTNMEYSPLLHDANERYEKDMLNHNGWKCKRCGAVNAAFVGTCACGMSRVDNDRALELENRKASELENLEKLKKYKELLDSGVITQEEFDKKKKELLFS